MSKREFWLGVLVILALTVVVGPCAYLQYQATVVEKEAEVEQKKIEQEEATKRTQERWDFMQRIPGLKDKDEKTQEK